EHADRCLLWRPGQTRGDVVADVEQEVEVLLAAGALLDAVHHLVEPARAFTARRALTARFVVEEAGDAPRRPHRARGVVHHHDRPRAEHGARLAHGVLVKAHADLVWAEPGGG